MYRVEFVTSRYLSFAEHIAQRDTSIYAHTADAMGAAAASTPSAVLAARSAEIAAAMSPAADPQLRQQLFTQLLSDVGLAKLHVCNRLTLTRLTGPAGVSALLFDSPEPLSFLHDVTATLLQSVLQRLPHPTAIGSPNPITAALSQLAFVNNGIVAPAAAAHTLYAAKVQVLLVTAAAPAFSMQEFSVPAPSLLGSVPLHRIRVLDAAGAQAAGLGALVSQPLGVLLAVRADHTIAGAVRWLAKVEVPVAMTLIGNADETSTLMLLPSSLGPGVYALRLAFSRTRWTTTTADPASLYQDSATMELSW
jgi:hypothetical protein